jgi:RNA polymerase sigma-70 factor (ECF subfamily)
LNGRSERKLAATWHKGDRLAYAGLVKVYSRRVFAICLGMLGNVDDAEDVAQQALLKGFTDIEQLRDSEQFGAWIGRIARNLCIDLLRRRKRERNALARQTEAGENNSGAYPELQDALARLPRRYRLALMLYYFDGRSTENIAETLQISRAAVYARMSRARKRLRKLLETEGDA